MACRLEKSRQWAIRCYHETKINPVGIFCTLTYNDDHLPSGETLIRSHMPSFIKRLRKKTPTIRTFYCGEYGEKTNRPHYHALIWGWDPSDKKLYKRSKGHEIFTSEIMEKTWGLGQTNFGAITFESAAYVARYTTKKITGPLAEEHYTTIDPDTGEINERLPEFSGQSRRPGVGIPWLKKYYQDIYSKDQVIIRGKPMRPPLAYDRWLKKHHYDLWEEVMENRLYKIQPKSEEEQTYKKSFNHAKARTTILDQKLQSRDQHS